MLIDCDACGVRGSGCADCVISALIGAPPVGVELPALPAGAELDDAEQAALGSFAAAGLALEFVSVTGVAEERSPDRHRTEWLAAQRAEAQRAEAQRIEAQRAGDQRAQAQRAAPTAPAASAQVGRRAG